MDGNTSHHEASSSGDNPYPALNMLPAFRVRGCRPTGHHGVVRLKKHEYDELLKRQPRAALSYIDESDGEVILVGSSLELGQRLCEPTENAQYGSSKAPSEDFDFVNKNLHIFDIEKEQAVVDEWRRFDIRTLVEGEKAKQLFFGRMNQPPQPPAKDKETTPAVRFGEVTPPRSSLKQSASFALENAHASRWASYSSLPGSFDKEPVPVTTTETPIKNPSKLKSKSTTDLLLASQTSQVGAPQPAAPAYVRSSTLQVPATQKQQSEHQPLIDMFYAEQQQQKNNTTASSKPATPQQPKEWRPLLELFETQLAELTGQSASSSSRPNDQTPISPKGPFAQKSGEILTQSIQSLLNGINLLATAFKKTNSELQQQIAVAQQDLPNNVDKALRASAAAIDSLRSMIPASKTEEQPEHAPAADADASATATASATVADSNNDTPPRGSDPNKDALKATTLSNRYKIQRHLLQPRPNQKHLDLAQINDILEHLELQTTMENITAEILIYSKIHKVLKRVSRSAKVPGDEEYRFKQRCSDLSQAWMAVLEKHRKAVQNAMAAAKQATSNKEDDKAAKPQAPGSNTQAWPTNQGNKLEMSWTSGQDEMEADRVEQITEQMRQELLELGLLPPPQHSSRRFYTRADVLEAYVSKFKELKQMVERQPFKPDVSNASTSTQVDQTPKNKAGGVVKDDSPFELMDTFLEQTPSELDNAKTTTPYSAYYSTDGHRNTEIKYPSVNQSSWSAPNGEALQGLQRQPAKTQVYAYPPPRGNPWPSYPPARAESTYPVRHSSTASTGPKKETYGEKLRHRRSWHLAQTPATGNAEQWSFDSTKFSPAAAMHRYPPVSQIKWQKPAGPSDSPPKWASPSMKAASMQQLPTMEPRQIYPEAGQARQFRAAPQSIPYRARNENGHQKVTFATKPNKAPTNIGQVAGEQDSQTKQNMKQCIDQLVEMGFVRGKAEAVALATLGNLEMSLDVLNEDSAAWKERSQAGGGAGGGRTTARHEEVPGSWGNWDDELYG